MPKNVTIVGFGKDKHTVDPRQNSKLNEGDKANPISVVDPTKSYTATVPDKSKAGEEVNVKMTIQTTTFKWNEAAEKWVPDGQKQPKKHSATGKMQSDNEVVIIHIGQ